VRSANQVIESRWPVPSVGFYLRPPLRFRLVRERASVCKMLAAAIAIRVCFFPTDFSQRSHSISVDASCPNTRIPELRAKRGVQTTEMLEHFITTRW